MNPLSTSIPGCELIAPPSGGPADVPSLGCLAGVIVNVINLALAFVGGLTLIFLLYGTILFITSRGDPKAVEKAKRTMTYAIFGAVAIMGIFILSNIVATALNVPNILTNFSLYLPHI